MCLKYVAASIFPFSYQLMTGKLFFLFPVGYFLFPVVIETHREISFSSSDTRTIQVLHHLGAHYGKINICRAF
jgi:hypothetical protein